MRKITVVIADDHPIFRLGLVNLVKQSNTIEIVAEADNGQTAFEKIMELKPDVAILDIEMPQLNGLQVCEKIQQVKLHTKVLLLTLFKEVDLYKKALAINASGYLLKDNAPNEIIKSIELLAKGEKYFSAEMEEKLIDGKSHLITDPAIAKLMDTLSNTEHKILKLIAEQLTTKDIANKLFISEKTVENHRYNINKKLNLPVGQNSLLKFAIEYKHLFK